jgi:hypothetical protein
VNDDEFGRLKDGYRDLLLRSKKGSAPVPEKALLAADGPRAFCAACAANEPKIDFWLKLFGLHEWFADHAPPAPAQGSDESAEQYLRDCLTLVRNEAERRSDEEIWRIAAESVASYATHFTGKFSHSSAKEAFASIPDRGTCQPHISSRRLVASGVEIPPDQVVQDNSGIFQCVFKVVQDEAIVAESGATGRVADLIRAGAARGMRATRDRQSQLVDPRLRQLLIPDGDDYLAITPLGSGGLSLVIGREAQRLEETWAAEDAAQKLAQQVEAGDPDAGTDRPRRGRKAKNESEPPEGQKKAKPPKRIERIKLLFGGANPRNVTAHWNNPFLQRPMIFHAPQRSEDVGAVVRFTFASWLPTISRKEAEAAGKQIAALNDSQVLGQSASLSAVDIQATGVFADLVRKCHWQALAFADLISQTCVPDGEAMVAVDEGLLSRRRGKHPTVLDVCLIRQNFGPEYRKAIAESILTMIWRKTKLTHPEGSPLDFEVARERVVRAIERVLERTK